ncbi:MAG: efflux RND transporter periplasmic adaptor subunit [Terrimicrobiaceae bacterium]
MTFRGVKKLVIVLIGLALGLGLVIGLKVFQIRDLIGFATEMEKAGMPPVPVATALAVENSWEDTLEFTGSLRAVQGVMLSAELGGKVSKIAVENGANVTEGEVLIELDTTQERADLAAAEANLRLAKANLERTKELMAKRIVAQSEFDTAAASYDESVARVATLQATIAKKIIRAPFSGRVGIRRVNLGQTVREGDELIPLHSSDPIYVEFSVPQTRLAGIRTGQKLRLTTDGVPNPVEGEITAINPVVDEVSRTARVQGTLRNSEGLLRAGQFARVEVVLPEKLEVVMIPLSAVIAAAYGDSVFVIEEKDGKLTARQQFVRVGLRRGDFVSIEKGLSAGDRVVSAGAFKLSNGATVLINDEMQPAASLSPTPDNS